MNIDEKINSVGISKVDYEACLEDIADKLDGTQDLEWEDIKNKYHIPYHVDVLRKANGTIFGGYSVYKYLQGKNSNSNDVFIDQLYELKKEKRKLADERNALNKKINDEARIEADIAKLSEIISSDFDNKYPSLIADKDVSVPSTGRDLIVCVSDVHYGQTVDSYSGEYNESIARQRFSEYLQDIIAIGKNDHCENVYVLLLGDLISGNIHLTTRLENREDAIEQVKQVSCLISEFLMELSKYFKTVYVNDVSGNHSRIDLKDNALRSARLDSLVSWYVAAALQTHSTIKFIDGFNYDATIASINVRGKEYLMVHGDFDTFDKNGVSRLILSIGHMVEGIFYGHMHHCSFDEENDIKLIRSGSFCGTGDDYSVSKRLHNSPSQMICVADTFGILSFYPITLH